MSGMSTATTTPRPPAFVSPLSSHWPWPRRTARRSSQGPFSWPPPLIKDAPRIEAAFLSGDGVGWHEHHHDLFAGTERFFRPGYAANLEDRVAFEVAPAGDFPGTGYDLVTMFDCLHDMGDPVGVAAHVLSTLHEDGSWMIVEPYAGDRLE